MSRPRHSYARILAHYPYVVLAVVLVVAVACLVPSILRGGGFGDFADPLAGFEARGTEISAKMVAYNNLVDNNNNRFTLTPFRHQQKKQQLKRIKTKKTLEVVAADEGDTLFYNETEPPDTNFLPETFFCSIPERTLSRLVLTTTDGSSLLMADNIRAMCDLDGRLVRKQTSFRHSCHRPTGAKRCCRSWSLGSYTALLQNRSRCQDITDEDIISILDLLKMCTPFYQNYSLTANCHLDDEKWFYSYHSSQAPCPGVPEPCTIYNAVYHILHYLLDRRFTQQVNLSSPLPHLQYSLLFLPVATGQGSMELFESLESGPGRIHNIQIAAAHFDIKTLLFEKYLTHDTFWLGAAGSAIFLAIWIYSTSIFVTVMTCLAIFWSLVFAYFFYFFVWKIKFFPYMNMVTVIIMIAIGSDDVFIFCKVWHIAKKEKNNGTLEKLVGDTLRHASLSMMVTSLTTAAAFFSNYITKITAIKCFSVYAGLAVVCNLVLMLTWVPASIMLYDKWCDFCSCCSWDLDDGRRPACCRLCQLPGKVFDCISDLSRIFFEKILPCIVVKLRFVWLAIFGFMGIGGMVIIFYYPGFHFPSSKKFQMFSSEHWLEMYDLRLSEHFDFEVNQGEDLPLLPLTVIWGVHPVDNGNPLNPHEKGTLELDTRFDLTTASAQMWLLDFCQRIRRKDFYLHTPGIQLTNCFLENFVYHYMKKPCFSYGSNPTSQCCNQTRFPYTKMQFTTCLNEYITNLQQTPGVHYGFHSPGPRFIDGHLSAFVVEFLSNQPVTLTFSEMQDFYTKVNQWMNEEMLKAPREMMYGWFISSHLNFFDLQQSLAHGTPLAMGLSLLIVLGVAFFTTLNVLISIYAILTIAFIFSVTAASLVLLGWELNILESVVITVAIGMSIDYTLHYGVAYRLSPDLDREMRVVCSIGRMGSAVSMAALTTFLAGALMMPSTVLAYKQFGTFLMLLISIGWVYSTFFFQSLLRTIGPQGGFSQFSWPACDCCSPGVRERVDKTIYAMSESTLSSSSTSNPNHGASAEMRELEPLNDGHHSQLHHHHHHHRPRSLRGGSYIQGKPLPPVSCGDSRNSLKKETLVTFDPTPEIEYVECENEPKHTRVGTCALSVEVGDGVDSCQPSSILNQSCDGDLVVV